MKNIEDKTDQRSHQDLHPRVSYSLLMQTDLLGLGNDELLVVALYDNGQWPKIRDKDIIGQNRSPARFTSAATPVFTAHIISIAE